MKRTPLKKVNRKRLAKLREKQFGPKKDWIKALPCCVPRCGNSGSEPHHAKTRGAGGTSADLVPLCTIHHQLIHDVGVDTFKFRYDVDPREVAEHYERLWKSLQ